MRDARSPEIYRPATGRPSVLVDVVQAMVVVGAFVVSGIVIIEPTLREVADTVDVRLEAMSTFDELARRLEFARDLPLEQRDAVMASVSASVRELRAAWESAGVCPSLRPAIEMRPIGPVLTLVDTGPVR